MRIALVNDMATALEAMRRMILSTREHRLAWIARDGAEAVDLCSRDIPDLILMDLIMPRMDGVEATRRIMARTPCPIVIVTANVSDHSSKVFEAMGAGALDAVNTPVLARAGTRGNGEALLAKMQTIRKLIGAERPCRHSLVPHQTGGYSGPTRTHLVGIGASAGGPTALAQVLADLPADFPAAVVIVQHVDAQFAGGLGKLARRPNSAKRAAGARGGPTASRDGLAGRSGQPPDPHGSRSTRLHPPAYGRRLLPFHRPFLQERRRVLARRRGGRPADRHGTRWSRRVTRPQTEWAFYDRPRPIQQHGLWHARRRRGTSSGERDFSTRQNRFQDQEYCDPEDKSTWLTKKTTTR